MNYVEPIRDKTTVQDIADYLREKDPKYYIMYMIGIYSGLRVSDILKLKVREGKALPRKRRAEQGYRSLLPG